MIGKPKVPGRLLSLSCFKRCHTHHATIAATSIGMVLIIPIPRSNGAVVGSNAFNSMLQTLSLSLSLCARRPSLPQLLKGSKGFTNAAPSKKLPSGTKTMSVLICFVSSELEAASWLSSGALDPTISLMNVFSWAAAVVCMQPSMTSVITALPLTPGRSAQVQAKEPGCCS